jgi:FkbM family methyltransferase
MNENKWLEPIINKYQHYFGDKADVVFDIGSRDGDDAKFISEKLGATKVYAIEANPLAAKQIRKRHKDFNLFETAVSDYDGTTSFTQIISRHKDEAGSSSIQNYSHFKGAEYNVIEVPVSKMDTLLKSNKLEDLIIDIAKVDIEGYTYECITGWKDLVKNVKLFHLETETFYRHMNHKNNNHVINLMLRHGFLLCDTSYQWGESIQDQIWINTRYLDSYSEGS